MNLLRTTTKPFTTTTNLLNSNRFIRSFNSSTSSSSATSPSTSSSTATKTPYIYPFSPTVQIIKSVSTPSLPLKDSLLRTLNNHLTSLSHISLPIPSSSTSSPSSTTTKPTTLLSLFSRRAKDRILPGSILTLTTYTSLPTPLNPLPSSTSFSGVLIALRRRHGGVDTSIRLRNLMGRTGVEVSFKLSSPLIKEVKIVLRASMSGVEKVGGGKGSGGDRKKPVLRASKRAKMYFVRDQPNRLVGVGGIVKQQREKEEKAALSDKRRR